MLPLDSNLSRFYLALQASPLAISYLNLSTLRLAYIYKYRVSTTPDWSTRDQRQIPHSTQRRWNFHAVLSQFLPVRQNAINVFPQNLAQTYHI